MIKLVSSEIGAGAFSSIVSFIDFKQLQTTLCQDLRLVHRVAEFFLPETLSFLSQVAQKDNWLEILTRSRVSMGN